MQEIKIELKKFANYLQKRAWQEMDKDFEDFVDEYMGGDVVNSSEVIHDVVGQSEQFKCGMKESKTGKKCETQCKECKEIYEYCSI